MRMPVGPGGGKGARGLMWVAIITSPGNRSPCCCIAKSFSAAASATIAPSASETIPMASGLPPSEPSRPKIPNVGAEPPACLPSVPGNVMVMKSV